MFQSIWCDVFLVVAGLVMLWWIGDRVVRYSVQIAHAFKVSTFFIGFIVLAIAADIPELAVAITSALKGVSAVAAGDIIGANFSDVAMVIGLTLLIAGRVHINKTESVMLVRMLAFTSLIMVIVLMRGYVAFPEGVALMVIYCVAVLWMWRKRRASSSLHQEVEMVEDVAAHEHDRYLESPWGLVTKLLICVGGVMYVSTLTVNGAIGIAEKFALPLETVGATILGIGTSLPELVLSLSALRRKQYGLCVGATLGTVLEQTTFILGTLAVLSSPEPVNLVGLRGAAMFMFAAFGIISYGLARYSAVTRRTGIALVSLFVFYLAYHLM